MQNNILFIVLISLFFGRGNAYFPTALNGIHEFQQNNRPKKTLGNDERFPIIEPIDTDMLNHIANLDKKLKSLHKLNSTNVSCETKLLSALEIIGKNEINPMNMLEGGLFEDWDQII